MEIRGNSSALDSLLLQVFTNRNSQNAGAIATTQPLPSKPAQRKLPQDIVNLSGQKPDNNTPEKSAGFQPQQTRLLSEDIEKLENGFRRTQEFETAEGRKFSRVEEFTADLNRARRTIIQQNSSGSIIQLENILDRQADGTFRSTERFTDEVGTVSTNIEFNVTPSNTEVILGKPPAPGQQDDNPFRLTRGTQIDLSA